MYKNLLLACDGTRESLVALREGALIAQMFKARAHLLIIDQETPGIRIAEAHGVQRFPTRGEDLLKLGLSRLAQLGVSASGEVLRGETVQLIAQCVRAHRIDLIVLGHKRQSFLDRWWSGPNGAYISDNVPCSVLVARDTISDADFERHLAAAAEH